MIVHFNCSIPDFLVPACQLNLSLIGFIFLQTPDINIKYYVGQKKSKKISHRAGNA